VRGLDFQRAIGDEVRIEMAVPVGTRKRFRGIIEGVEAVGSNMAARLRLAATDDGEGALGRIGPIRDMEEARLVLQPRNLIRATCAAKSGQKKTEGAKGKPSRDKPLNHNTN